jgi:hypothetical protein
MWKHNHKRMDLEQPVNTTYYCRLHELGRWGSSHNQNNAYHHIRIMWVVKKFQINLMFTECLTGKCLEASNEFPQSYRSSENFLKSSFAWLPIARCLNGYFRSRQNAQQNHLFSRWSYDTTPPQPPITKIHVCRMYSWKKNFRNWFFNCSWPAIINWKAECVL